MGDIRMPKLITNLEGHWEKALQNRVVRVAGKVYQIKSADSQKTYTVDLRKSTCDCYWATNSAAKRAGCAHIVTAYVHRANIEGYRVELQPAYIKNVRADVPKGKPEGAAGQFVLGDGIKVVFWDVPGKKIINQLRGEEREVAEDLQQAHLRLGELASELAPDPEAVEEARATVNALSKPENFQDPAFDDHEAEDEPWRWALAYARLGYSPVKLGSLGIPGEKISSWQKYTRRPAHEKEIMSWFPPHKGAYDFELGLVCGVGGLVVLEIHADVYPQWLVAAYGLLSNNPPVTSRMYPPHATAGYQLFFKTPQKVRSDQIIAYQHTHLFRVYGKEQAVAVPPTPGYSWESSYRDIPHYAPRLVTDILNLAREVAYAFGRSRVDLPEGYDEKDANKEFFE